MFVFESAVFFFHYLKTKQNIITINIKTVLHVRPINWEFFGLLKEKFERMDMYYLECGTSSKICTRAYPSELKLSNVNTQISIFHYSPHYRLSPPHPYR